jgi:hypothetical protein
MSSCPRPREEREDFNKELFSLYTLSLRQSRKNATEGHTCSAYPYGGSLLLSMSWGQGFVKIHKVRKMAKQHEIFGIH